MVGVVIGIGEGWTECARWTARRMELATGIPCHVISDYLGEPPAHPSWEKCRLSQRFPGEDLLVFDADLMPVIRWNPLEWLEPGTISMCLDGRSETVQKECRTYGADYDTYCNAGLMVIHRDCTVLQRTLARHPNGGSWMEQTALNLETQAGPDRLLILPQELNVLARAQRIDRRTAGGKQNSHFVRTRPDRLKRLQSRFESVKSGKTLLRNQIH